MHVKAVEVGGGSLSCDEGNARASQGSDGVNNSTGDLKYFATKKQDFPPIVRNVLINNLEDKNIMSFVRRY
jgi:hypothetical protein